MRIFKDYLYQRKNVMIVFFVCFLIITFIFHLYYLELEAIFYAFGLCFFIILGVGCYDYYHYYHQRKELKKLQQTIQYSLENIQPHNPLEQDYHDIIAKLIQTIHQIESQNDAIKQDMLDYYTLWAHQIKLPISAMHLLLQNDQHAFPLSAELIKIEQYVDMVLSYLRLNSQTTDYVIKTYDLDDIIRSAIRKLSTLFIEKHLHLDFQPTHQQILTDAKWLQYVLEQLLSNAIKYTKEGTISIYYIHERLIIEDTGIGIEEADIKRIFEKGFTGYNGRVGEKSSGLGLYLCDKILRNLSHTIEIESKVGVGTKVILNLTHQNIQIE